MMSEPVALLEAEVEAGREAAPEPVALLEAGREAAPEPASASASASRPSTPSMDPGREDAAAASAAASMPPTPEKALAAPPLPCHDGLECSDCVPLTRRLMPADEPPPGIANGDKADARPLRSIRAELLPPPPPPVFRKRLCALLLVLDMQRCVCVGGEGTGRGDEGGLGLGEKSQWKAERAAGPTHRVLCMCARK